MQKPQSWVSGIRLGNPTNEVQPLGRGQPHLQSPCSLLGVLVLLPQAAASLDTALPDERTHGAWEALNYVHQLLKR